MEDFKKLADLVEGQDKSKTPQRSMSLRVPGYLEFSLRSVADIQDVPYTRLAVMLLEIALEQYAPIAVERHEAKHEGNSCSDLRPSAVRRTIGDKLMNYHPETFGSLTREEKIAEFRRRMEQDEQQEEQE